MIYLKKATMGAIAFSFIFCATVAKAQVVVTDPQQIMASVKDTEQQLEEGVNQFDQKAIGTEQLKSMGSKYSGDMLKDKAGEDDNMGGTAKVKTPKEMQDLGFIEGILNDPEKIMELLNQLKEQATAKDAKPEDRRKCIKARDSMSQAMQRVNLANSLKLQNNAASGDKMKQAQDLAAASDDQMQLIGANTGILKLIYGQIATSNAMMANSMTSNYLEKMCGE